MAKINQEKAARVLKEKGADKNCSRCGNDKFSILGEYFNMPIQSENGPGRPLIVGGPFIPTIVVGCNKCGALTLHAIGVLGDLEGP